MASLLAVLTFLPANILSLNMSRPLCLRPYPALLVVLDTWSAAPPATVKSFMPVMGILVVSMWSMNLQ